MYVQRETIREAIRETRRKEKECFRGIHRDLGKMWRVRGAQRIKKSKKTGEAERRKKEQRKNKEGEGEGERVCACELQGIYTQEESWRERPTHKERPPLMQRGEGRKEESAGASETEEAEGREK